MGAPPLRRYERGRPHVRLILVPNPKSRNPLPPPCIVKKFTGPPYGDMNVVHLRNILLTKRSMPRCSFHSSGCSWCPWCLGDANLRNSTTKAPRTPRKIQRETPLLARRARRTAAHSLRRLFRGSLFSVLLCVPSQRSLRLCVEIVPVLVAALLRCGNAFPTFARSHLPTFTRPRPPSPTTPLTSESLFSILPFGPDTGPTGPRRLP
jgi:hypothetical protein